MLCLHVMDEGLGWEKASARWDDVHRKGVSGAGEGVAGGAGNGIRLRACATGKTCMRVGARVG